MSDRLRDTVAERGPGALNAVTSITIAPPR
jgi:hypothetical protein